MAPSSGFVRSSSCQLDIFAVAARKAKAVEAPPYQHQVETSRAAAVSIRPVAGTLRARVLEVITAEACTDEEGISRSGMAANTWRPRRIELLEAGLITRTGVRPGKSGRLMSVWSAAAAGEFHDAAP